MKSSKSDCPTSLLLLSFQTFERAEHLNRPNTQTTARTLSFGHSDGHSRGTHSHAHRDAATRSPSTQQTQGSQLPAHQDKGLSDVSDGRVPSSLANTLEHIIGQLDVLTQVSRRCADLYWQTCGCASHQLA